MTDQVKRIIERTLLHEGGYSFDKDDPGGETKYGISKRQYPTVDIKALTLSDAAAIYARDYYDPLHLDLIDSIRVRWKVFDIGVNCGVTTAARMLQRVAHVDPDGVIGKGTSGAVNIMDNAAVLAGLVEEQKRHYKDIVERKPKQRKYLSGWLARADDTGENL